MKPNTGYRVVGTLFILSLWAGIQQATAAPDAGDSVPTTSCSTAAVMDARLGREGLDPAWMGRTPESNVILYLNPRGRWVLVESFGPQLVCVRAGGVGYGAAERSE